MRVTHSSMLAGFLVAGLAVAGCGSSTGSAALGLQGAEEATVQVAADAAEPGPDLDAVDGGADAAPGDAGTDATGAAASDTPVLDGAGALKLASMAPGSGPATGDTLVTFTGRGFDTVVSVTFGGEEAVDLEIVSPTEMLASTPVGEAGVVDVVITDDIGDEVSPAGGFTYVVRAQGPKIVVAAPGDGFAKIAFTVPNDGGGAIVDYEYTLDDGATWKALDPPQVETPLKITGLTNGTEYLVALRAITEAGPGARGNSKAVTPRAAATSVAKPDRAVITKSSVGNGSISVSFAGSPSSGLAKVSGFECSLDGGTTWASCANPVAFEGLDNGTAYVFQVRALNAGGGGPAKQVTLTPKAPAAPIAKPVKPSAPTLTKTTPGRSATDGWVQVYFTGPQHTGVNAITGYRCIISSATARGTWGPCTNPYTVRKLTKGVRYTVAVEAVNRAGISDPAKWSFTAK